jgi:hypothetical protein
MATLVFFVVIITTIRETLLQLPTQPAITTRLPLTPLHRIDTQTQPIPSSPLPPLICGDVLLDVKLEILAHLLVIFIGMVDALVASVRVSPFCPT